ncbi:MAG TPA: U32 family peptidase [Bacillus sp. (in: firmicutes)]|nr:U32 family peptidase [Bacillus sp. (in: firmicutes)]
MIEHIPELMNSRINSFKIEGRMKSPLEFFSIPYNHYKGFSNLF